MAITQTGSTLTYPINSSANTGTVSTTITVPGDAELVVVGVSVYQGTAEGIETMTFTKGGADTAMVKARLGLGYLTGGVGSPGDAVTCWPAGLFFLALPDTGSNKTLKWDWIGAGTSGDSDQLFSVTFWKGIDTTDPVRDVKGWQRNSFPVDLHAPLICQTGDLILAFYGGYAGGAEGATLSWNGGLSVLSELTHQGDADGAWATGTSSVPVIVGLNTVTGFTEGTLACITLKPPSGSTDIEQVGPVLSYGYTNTANTGTVSSTIYVPPEAEIVLVGVAQYQGTNSGLAAMTFTKSGADTAMTKVTGGDTTAAAGNMQSAIFYMVAPDTGHNKSLKWDWIGSGVSSDGAALVTLTFWRNVHASTPVRDSDAAQGTSIPITTPTLTAQSGDKIVAWFGGYNTTGVGSVDAWTNLTTLENMLQVTGGTDGAWATGSPSGNTTVSVATVTNITIGGLCAVVLVPSATSTSVSVDVTTNSAAVSVGTAMVPTFAVVTGNTMAVSVGNETVTIDGVSTSGDVPREVGNPGTMSMGRLMGN